MSPLHDISGGGFLYVRCIKNEETVRFEAVYYTLNSYKEPEVYYTKNSDLQEIQVYPVNI